jgi:hypothetical protein
VFVVFIVFYCVDIVLFCVSSMCALPFIIIAYCVSGMLKVVTGVVLTYYCCSDVTATYCALLTYVYCVLCILYWLLLLVGYYSVCVLLCVVCCIFFEVCAGQYVINVVMPCRYFPLWLLALCGLYVCLNISISMCVVVCYYFIINGQSIVMQCCMLLLLLVIACVGCV